MNPAAEPPVMPTPPGRRWAIFLKVAGICVLIGLLHVPLLLTHGVLRERQAYRAQVTGEIAGVWGGVQTVTGPVLAVPYVHARQMIRPKAVDGKVVQVEETELAPATAYFLPELLTVAGAIEPAVRRRGIHAAVVYATTLTLAGHFQPDFAAAGIATDRIDWDRAQVLVGVSDLRGVRSVGPWRSGSGLEAPFETAGRDDGAGWALAAKVAGAAPGARLDFSFAAAVQGSDRLLVAPAGKVTRVRLTSPWADPSFSGAYLPVRREVGPEGFAAEWETAHFSRGFPQAWTSRADAGPERAAQVAAEAFGVTFAQPVDGYRLAERAQKYGVLFFVLTFAVFFLFEITAGLRIHPLQYAMVGAALCLFFLGFLALGEFMDTARAYVVAAAACTAMVALYAGSFLRTGARTRLIGGGLAATYGYLFFVLRSQDYALVAGTAALFAVLAAVMFGTRRINWYTLEMARPSSAES